MQFYFVAPGLKIIDHGILDSNLESQNIDTERENKVRMIADYNESDVTEDAQRGPDAESDITEEGYEERTPSCRSRPGKINTEVTRSVTKNIETRYFFVGCSCTGNLVFKEKNG
jgi:hypothetical protein